MEVPHVNATGILRKCHSQVRQISCRSKAAPRVQPGYSNINLPPPGRGGPRPASGHTVPQGRRKGGGLRSALGAGKHDPGAHPQLRRNGGGLGSALGGCSGRAVNASGDGAAMEEGWGQPSELQVALSHESSHSGPQWRRAGVSPRRGRAVFVQESHVLAAMEEGWGQPSEDGAYCDISPGMPRPQWRRAGVSPRRACRQAAYRRRKAAAMEEGWGQPSER